MTQNSSEDATASEFSTHDFKIRTAINSRAESHFGSKGLRDLRHAITLKSHSTQHTPHAGPTEFGARSCQSVGCRHEYQTPAAQACRRDCNLREGLASHDNLEINTGHAGSRPGNSRSNRPSRVRCAVCPFPGTLTALRAWLMVELRRVLVRVFTQVDGSAENTSSDSERTASGIEVT